MQDMGPAGAIATDVEGDRKGTRVKAPRSLSARAVFEDERATEAVLAFLQGTKVGCMVSIAPPEEEEEGIVEGQNRP